MVARQHRVTSLLCKAVGVCRMMGPTLQGMSCPPIFVDASKHLCTQKCRGGIAESDVQTFKKSIDGFGSQMALLALGLHHKSPPVAQGISTCL